MISRIGPRIGLNLKAGTIGGETRNGERMLRPCFCDKASCHLCKLYHTNPVYTKLWDGAARAERPPRLSVDQLAERKSRCRERKAAGLPCKEFEVAMPHWSYGVTTVPSRRQTLLPKVLASLAAAGFDAPRLFIDGCLPSEHDYGAFKNAANWPLECSYRYPKIRAYGNWILALAELYIRQPTADRYALFQDDVLACAGLKKYLDGVPYPNKGYLNLCTFMSSQEIAPKHPGFFEGREFKEGQSGVVYHGKMQQLGRGAQGLVFNREAVQALLSAQHMIIKPTAARFPHKKIDGAVVEAMNQAGYREWVHNPSLLQHIGAISTLGHPSYPTVSFNGESWNAAKLLP